MTTLPRRATAALFLLAFSMWPVASTLGSDKDGSAVEPPLQSLLATGERLRDYAHFVTERGERATLLLFVTDAVEPAVDAEPPRQPTCSEMVAGVPLRGTYHLGLVVGGELINKLTIPDNFGKPRTLDLPVRNTAELNYQFWGQGKPTKSHKVEATKLVKLADFNGDGHAWEFRLVQYGVCGHVMTLLAGYSAIQRKVVIFPVVQHDRRNVWRIGVFPSPVETPAKVIEDNRPCGDLGAKRQYRRTYTYRPKREAWVLTREQSKDCE